MAEETTAGRALFPDREVRLANGRTVVVRPWGMATGRRLSPRIVKLMTKLRGFATADVVDLITEFQDEVFDIVADTIGYDDAKMDTLAYEDLFTLAQAIIDTSLIRRTPDGEIVGTLGKLMTLAGAAPEQAILRALRVLSRQKNETSESPSTSSSSSPRDTPTPKSETTPSKSSTSSSTSPAGA
jgi:hypothetical protein